MLGTDVAQKVGSLIISLALESGAFKSGLSASEKELKAASRRIEAVGKSMQGVGQKLSLAVSLPLLALGRSAIKAASESHEDTMPAEYRRMCWRAS